MTDKKQQADDPRHLKRISIVQDIFASTFAPNEQKADTQISTLDEIKKILAHNDTFDSMIHSAAPKYETEKIARVDLAILRLALFELFVEKKAPVKVVINEAVELAKELSGEKSPSFVNAVLGKIYDKHPDLSLSTE